MHPDQIDIGTDAVRELVREQFSEWMQFEITPVASSGTMNAVFCIGERFSARFPSRNRDPDLVRSELKAEQLAARALRGVTRFRTPEPVAIGEPGQGYPLPWLVQTWLPGVTAQPDDCAENVSLARDMAQLILNLRTIPVNGQSFSGVGRGGALSSHEPWVQECFERSDHLLNVDVLRRIWAVLRSLPRVDADATTHGDLIPSNLLVENGRLTGVLDVGGLGPTDPALDLVCAWHLFEEDARDVLRTELRCNDLEWERGKAWAFEQALGLVWYYADSNPDVSLLGRNTLRRIIDATAV